MALTYAISGRSASLFNKLWSMNAVPTVVQKNALLYAALGKPVRGNPDTPFERFNWIDGDKIEERVLGSLDTIGTVANGSAELGAATITYNADMFGGMSWDFTHYYDVKGMTSTEYNRIRGSQAKTNSFIDDVMNQIMYSFENTLGTGIHAQVAGATDTVVGNWQHPVSDGTSSGETGYDSYGGITRSTAGNEQFRGNVSVATATLTLPKIRTAQNTVDGYGGVASLGVAGTTVYGIIQQLVEAYTVITSDEAWTGFKGEWFQYGPTKYCHDQRTSSGVLGMLNPETFGMWMRKINFTEQGFVKYPGVKAGYVMDWEAYVQFLCKRPNQNYKFTGVTN